MQTEEQLYQEIQNLEQRWSAVSNAYAELQNKHDLETRIEEKLRLEPIIAENQTTLGQIEILLETKKPANYPEIQRRVLTNNAHLFKRNRAYEDALEAWKLIANLYPEDSEAKESIDLLERLLQEQLNVKALRTRLTQRLKEIRPVFNAVISRLNKLSNTDDDQVILQTIEMFVDNELSANDFIENWEVISEETISTQTTIDYGALARRIQRSEMILFLGSDIPAEYDSEVINDADLIKYLAKEAKFEPLTASLSAVAEYYELRDEYSRTELIEKLTTKLPDNHKQIDFYTSLAKMQRPLILISTAYDNLLEKTFNDHRKPYVEIASIVNRSDQYDIGSVVVRYSDKDEEKVYSEEKLSNQDLLEQGYSLIYKIRGTCDTQTQTASANHSPRQDAMTLMESDFFKFARYADRIIPGYIAKQFRTRDFLFLGYQPRNWEDRLLVNALLEKRGLSSRDCLMIGKCSDPFEIAYWDKRKVKRYNVTLRHLDGFLKQTCEAVA